MPLFFFAAGPDWYLVRVELTVLDVNDNAPEWTMVPFPYLAVVSPIAAPSTLVYKLTARDGDEGVNGEVEYFLSDGKTAPFITSFCTGAGESEKMKRGCFKANPDGRQAKHARQI